MLFSKFANAVADPGAPVTRPGATEKLDLECELVMLKVEVTAENARAVTNIVRTHRASLLDESDNTRMVQLTGTGAEVEAFLAELTAQARIVELVRSGVAALARGHNVLTIP